MPKRFKKGLNSKAFVKTHSQQIEHDPPLPDGRSGLDPVENYRQAGRALGVVVTAALKEHRPSRKLIYLAILVVLWTCLLGPSILTRLFPHSQQQLLDIDAANESWHADWQFLSSLGVGFLPFVRVDTLCGECYRWNRDQLDVHVIGRTDRPAFVSDACTDVQAYMRNPTSGKWDLIALAPGIVPSPAYSLDPNHPEETLLLSCRFDLSTLKAAGTLRITIFGYSDPAKAAKSKAAAYADVEIK